MNFKERLEQLRKLINESNTQSSTLNHFLGEELKPIQLEGYLGKMGITKTDLRLNGLVFLDGMIFEAIARHFPIKKGCKVKVVGVSFNSLVVEEVFFWNSSPTFLYH